MKYLVYLALYISGISITAAQSFQGNVQQRNTAVIEGAIINVLNSEHTAITDKSGNFRLRLPVGIYTLSIGASGFIEHTQTITISNPTGKPTIFIWQRVFPISWKPS